MFIFQHFRGILFIWFKLSERNLVLVWGYESLAAPPPPLPELTEVMLVGFGESTQRQSWALAHFFVVRYPLPTQFFPLDRWRSCVHFLNYLFARRSNARRSTNGSLSEKGLNHSSLSIILSYIYLRPSVCHSIILSFCHSCETLSYSLCFGN